MQLKAHDTHRASLLRRDIASRKADTLLTILHRKLWVQTKTLCISVEKQFIHILSVQQQWEKL